MNQPPGRPVPRLEITGLNKRFGGVRALDGVDLSIAPGRIHALLGENGAGKSSLLKCLSGVYRPDGGAMRLDGVSYAPADPRAAEAAGLRFVHQELNLVPGFTAAENAFVGRPYPRRFGLIDRQAMHRRLAAIRDRLGIALPLNVPVRHLSVGQCQLVEILRALMDEARILVLDEPTASLSESEAGILRKVVATLAQAGCAVIFVSHRMEEVFELAQDYTVLRNGVTVGQGLIGETTPDAVVAMMAGDAQLRDAVPPPAIQAGKLLELDGFSPSPRHGSLHLRAHGGEIIGVYGIVGSGRSSLLKALWGAMPQASGKLSLAGRPLPPRGIPSRIRSGVAFAPEDRRGSGLVLGQSILDNAALPRLSDGRAVAGLPFLSWPALRRNAGTMLERLAVRYSRLADRIATLSGGNQQKVLIGRWFRPGLRLFLLDEPTRGVDVRSKAEIHALCRRLAGDGTLILFATSDIEELFALAGRILVMVKGEIALDAPTAGLTRQQVLAATFGTARPHRADHSRRTA
ncbi:sugar ABC transporter ATP-binding protein [Labrys okinawensis]|uniref:Sugar ABC transporter ATP-binding protein n=1 Tax=Labrys okinawensis TaxID=346911 RepID=A0A2S9QBH6_9HYPH|nr:sugar ABC transporter ATP-binding protein [Labrys okinawensis]PRH86675.1 sugar ABC transporter ATP-binding protein [Labrys okinawensis]